MQIEKENQFTLAIHGRERDLALVLHYITGFPRQNWIASNHSFLFYIHQGIELLHSIVLVVKSPLYGGMTTMGLSSVKFSSFHTTLSLFSHPCILLKKYSTLTSQSLGLKIICKS